MNIRYKPRRQTDTSNIPWVKTPGGLQVVDLADVPPVLDAYNRADDNGLAVWCIFCKRWHCHGVGEDHRAAHCHVEDSPYIRTV